MLEFLRTYALIMLMIFTQGCASTIYQNKFTQGNIFSKEDVQKIKIGMSKDDVIAILGHPLIDSYEEDHKWTYLSISDYIVFHRKNIKKFVIYFKNDRVEKIGDLS